MALYTPLSAEDAARVAEAHGLAPPSRVEGVVAGSVNSSYVLHAASGAAAFLRIYEEQGADGAAYEWALLDHLARAGLPVPARIPGPAPGALRVGGKVVGLFEVIEGDELCQARVDPPAAAAVGALLARAHLAGASFPRRRPDRFGLDAIEARLDAVAALDRPELRAACGELRAAIAEVRAAPGGGCPGGVIHGDLFRDNVRWRAGRVVGLLDWESAADGLFVQDLAVTCLAWCWSDALRPELARALIGGYRGARELEPAERAHLRVAAIEAAVRFTVTRITDFHLREADGRVKKDWRRFRARLAAVRAWTARDVASLAG